MARSDIERLSEILREKLSRATWRVDWTLTIHLFFIEYAEELERLLEKDISEILKSAGADIVFLTEYRKMKKIAKHVTIKASYPPE